jgi:protein-tyrosine phosphatase
MNRHLLLEKKLEYSRITDNIFIGTNRCCATHFDAVLMKEGISADISLEHIRIDQPFGVEMYVWLPVKDHTAPTPDQLSFGVSALERAIALGKKVYIHCKNGHGRAPTLVAAYLVAQGKSPEEAEAAIKARRPAIHLEEVQKEALQVFAKQYKQ